MDFTNINNSESFREMGHATIDLLADYLESIANGKLEKVIPYINPQSSYEFWKNDFENGSQDLVGFFKNTIEKSNHLHHPQYMGHQVSAPSPVAALSGLISSVLNNGGAVYEMGMVNNPIEKLISEILADKIGYGDDAGGYLTSGGTLANLTALLAARAKYSEVWNNGTAEKLGVMVSEEAHYCVDRAARIMGLGSEGVIKLKTNKKYQLETAELEKSFLNAAKNGIKIFAVIGSACSTSTGSYDDLEKIGKFSKSKDIWFHVDGAHGGAVVFSKKYKSLVKGIEMSDSVAIDWHKMLLAPALATSLVFKNNQEAYQTFQQKAQYLWDDAASKDWYNSGKRTFECTKLMMGVKVYAIIKAHGIGVFEQNVDYLYDLAKEFANLVKNKTNFELAVEPQSNIVCFRVKHPNINLFNTEIRKILLEEGGFYIVQTLLNGEVYLRVSLMNSSTNLSHLVSLLNRIEEIAHNLDS
jgi:L-2,4-diaminobutyrate decarboxylase